MTSLESARARVEVLTAEANELRAELATERGKRCGSCRHWDWEGVDYGLGGKHERRCRLFGSGECERLRDGYESDITTREDFGCVEWEAKG